MTAGRRGVVRGAAALALVATLASGAAAQAADDLDAGAGGAGSGGPVAGQPDAGGVVVDGPSLSDVARPQAGASASPSQLQLGETLTLFIEVVFDERASINLPSTLDLGDAFDELRRSSKDEVRHDGTRKRIYQLELRVWELGELSLPPIQIGYEAGGERSWVVTNAVPLRVLGMLGDVDDKTALVGDTPPVPLRRRDWRWVLAAAVALTVIVVGVLALWWRTRKPKPTPALERAVRMPVRAARVRLSGAAERALAALTALDKAGTLASEPRVGYDQLVAILRKFWHEQFAVGIRDRTSAELIKVLARTSMPAPALTASARWLERCDLVKFAKLEPDDDRRAADLTSARELIYAAIAAPPPVATAVVKEVAS